MGVIPTQGRHSAGFDSDETCNAPDAKEFPAEETHGFHELDSVEVHKSSKGQGWRNAFFSVQSIGPTKARFDAAPSILVAIINQGSLRADINLQGYRNKISHRDMQMGAGSVFVLGNNVSGDMNFYSSIRTTHLYLGSDLVNEVASEVCDAESRPVRIVTGICRTDSILKNICEEIGNTLDEPHSLRYVEYLTRTAAAHLVRGHSNIAAAQEQIPSRARLSAKALGQALEQIEGRLDERFTVADLAADIGMGVDHFSRLFKQSTGMSPHQFVMRQRIDRARYMLENTDKPIIQIAYECGFADQVHLTRAFKRLIGTTPASFRRERNN